MTLTRMLLLLQKNTLNTNNSIFIFICFIIYKIIKNKKNINLKKLIKFRMMIQKNYKKILNCRKLFLTFVK